MLTDVPLLNFSESLCMLVVVLFLLSCCCSLTNTCLTLVGCLGLSIVVDAGRVLLRHKKTPFLIMYLIMYLAKFNSNELNSYDGQIKLFYCWIKLGPLSHSEELDNKKVQLAFDECNFVSAPNTSRSV